MWDGSLKIQNLGCLAILSFLLRFGDSTHELHFLFARESLTNNIKSDYKSVRRILVRGSMPPCRLRRRRGWANPFAPMCGRPWVTMQRHSYRPTRPQSEDIFHRVKSINLSAVRLYIYTTDCLAFGYSYKFVCSDRRHRIPVAARHSRCYNVSLVDLFIRCGCSRMGRFWRRIW